MKCDKCGQDVREHPDNRLFLQKSCGDINLFCNVCEHDFGPVRDLIRKAGEWRKLISDLGDAEKLRLKLERHYSSITYERDRLRETNATLTRERDEARKREHEHLDLLDAYRQIDDKARARIAELEGRGGIRPHRVLELLNGIDKRVAEIRTEVKHD